MYLYLAPMDGITDLAYRLIVKKIFDKYNPNDKIFFTTEFMSADGYKANPYGVIKHLLKSNIDKPLTAQIFGGNTENLIHTAQDIIKYGFDGIELNIGCPSPKIMACGGGSAMLKDKKETLNTIKLISSGINIPFSIKTRIGLDQQDKKQQFDFICQASKYCQKIAIHGRTFKQGHSGDVDWDFIYLVKKEIGKDCMIIGNGGVKDYEDAKNKLGNLDGIMIGQQAIGNPWIFTQHKPNITDIYQTIIDHLQTMLGAEIYFKSNPFDTNGNLIMPTEKDIKNCLKMHDGMDDQEKLNLKTPIEFRKHLFSYLKGIPESKAFKQKVVTIKDYDTLKQSINKFFENIA